MQAYTGFEPQVGEIRALRTFRIGPGGLLYPLFSDRAWEDGTNTARCRAPRTPEDATPHPVPEPDCTCGFYAYGAEAAAMEYPAARYVLAVVSAWGHVIAGTRGLRSEHARVEAIWMSAAVPADLAAMAAEHYPSMRVYTDKGAMLAEHPLTALGCYELSPDARRANSVGLRIAVCVAILLGLLPTAWLGGNADARIVWASELGFFVLAAAITHRRHVDAADKRKSLLYVAVALWLIAPYAGTAATLMLRLPLLQIAALTTRHRILLSREARRFPAHIGLHPR